MRPFLLSSSIVFLFGCGNPSQSITQTMPTPIDARQADRARSLFTNLDFEDVDASGTPTAWTCQCSDESGVFQPTACHTSTTNASHGKRVLVLDPSCTVSQATTTFDPNRGVRFDLFAAGALMYPENGSLYSVKAGVALDSLTVEGLSDASEAWRQVASIGPLSAKGAERLVLSFSNRTSDALRLDDIVVRQDVPTPAARTATLIRADHYEHFSYTGSKGPASMYTPLPLDYASQVPLYVELIVTPASVVERIEYTTEDEGNWGALVHFRPGQSESEVTLAWKAVVLTRMITDDERPTLYAAVSSPTRWLMASPIADAGYAPIAAQGAKLAAGASSPLEAMKATLGFTSTYVTNLGQLSALDATSVWNTHDASCTGFANLASALGRSLGVPTRHVVNMLVGVSQAMHSINEFYLGPQLGWRRVEPQDKQATVPEDYGLIMRLALPEDEGAAALPTRPWVLGGAPLREFTEPASGGDSFSPVPNDHFADCLDCLNRADRQADLREPGDTVRDVFARARSTWRVDRAAYVMDAIELGKMAIRREALKARTLADVDALLAKLQ